MVIVDKKYETCSNSSRSTNARTYNLIEEYEMNKVQRAVVGGYVQADVDGMGTYVVGRIVDIDHIKNKVSFETAAGEEIVVPRSELYKATEKDFKASAAAVATKPEPKAVVKAKATVKPVSKKNEEPEEDEELEERVAGMAQALHQARERYTKAKLPSGRETAHSNDKVANELHGLTLEEVKAHVAKKMDTSAASLTRKYGHLNRGHQRMLIGIAYRKFLREQAAAE